MARLAGDCEMVANQLTSNLNMSSRAVIQVILLLGYMATLSWRLTLPCVVAVPAVVAATKAMGNFQRECSSAARSALAEANSVASESLGAILTVKAHCAEPEEARRYASACEHYIRCQWRASRAFFVYNATMFTLLPYATYAIILYYGAQLLLAPEPQIEPRALVAFVFYMQSLFSAFELLGMVYANLMAGVGAAEKVAAWMRRQPVLASPARGDAPVPARCEGHVSLEAVRFRYALRPERLVLDGVSLEARPGAMLALCGPSGGGKSSCLALIEGFYAAESGAVRLDGTDVLGLPAEYLRQHVAIVAQDPVLFARSVRDNVAYGLDGAHAGGHTGDCEFDSRGRDAAVLRAIEDAHAAEFVRTLPMQLDAVVGERGSQLSGGQKQRVAIARALVRRPKVLLLDEATSALDARSEAAVQAALDRLMTADLTTVILVAHRLSTVRHAGRIIVLKDGRACESGTHDELVASGGEYASLVAKQMRGSSSGGVADAAAS